MRLIKITFSLLLLFISFLASGQYNCHDSIKESFITKMSIMIDSSHVDCPKSLLIAQAIVNTHYILPAPSNNIYCVDELVDGKWTKKSFNDPIQSVIMYSKIMNTHTYRIYKNTQISEYLKILSRGGHQDVYKLLEVIELHNLKILDIKSK